MEITSDCSQPGSQSRIADHDLTTLWPELVAGRARIVAFGATEERYYFHIASSATHPRMAGVTPRNVEFLERVLLGTALKVIAIDAGCSASMVTSVVRDGLRRLGLQQNGARVPVLLVLMMHALRGRARAHAFRIERTSSPHGEVCVVSTARPERYLAGTLSSSETAVVGLLCQGFSYAEIACERATSPRTVANQITSAYRKLGVSGRLALLSLLASKLDGPSEASSARSRGSNGWN